MAINKLLENFQEKDPLVKIVYEIVSYIKMKDYLSGYSILKENNLTFINITERTQRLKLGDLAKFADFVICHAENGK